MAESMEGVQFTTDDKDVESIVYDIIAKLSNLQAAVIQFDARLTLRALRAISRLRKHITPTILSHVIHLQFAEKDPTAKALLASIGQGDAPTSSLSESWARRVKQATKEGVKPLPEEEVYLSILWQVYLYDNKQYQAGAKFSTELVDKIRDLNRRSLDALAAKAYFYFSLFHEALEPHPPSRQSPVISIRGRLLAALRSSVLRRDEETQAAVTTLLLRNYISTADITQADLLVAQTHFPPTASNNQVARFLFYLGRIRAIQLSYTEAHDHLTDATRKSPTNSVAAGFYQAAMKLLVVVELLMGDIPDRAIFRQASLERALEPYLRLVQAVRVGDLQGFQRIVQKHALTFRRDGTYTLIMRLRQNVIKTGVRMLSLSYSRISLRDICIKLGVESEQSAEYIVAKAIRDGVIEATIDHEKGYMESKQSGDVYATREPAEAFHERIQACLALHDESVKAMRFPMNQHRLELKNAQEARERERELAKEIQDGDIDEDDAGGDFDGLIPVPTRLRRAILLNDLVLVKRIVKNHPAFLQNPDYDDKSNTSLHLCAKHGFVDIAIFLIDAGHEEDGISQNSDGDTPLMVAVQSQVEMAQVLVERFPRCVEWQNKQGVDSLMLASQYDNSPLIPLLLATSSSLSASSSQTPLSARTVTPTPNSFTPLSPNSANPPPSILSQQDVLGNTALHYASAYGSLKALRLLVHAGANPLATNAGGWTPIHYSATVAAEVYFRNLVLECERWRVEGERERRRVCNAGSGVAAGGIRVVPQEGDDDGEGKSRMPGKDVGGDNEMFKRPEIPRKGTGGLSEMRDEMMREAQRNRAATPTEERKREGWVFSGLRTRASSGD